MLEAANVRVAFGGVVAVDDVSFGVVHGAVVAVVGPNGSGKTTLLNAVTGLVRHAGTVTLDGELLAPGRPDVVRRAAVLRTFQTPQVLDELSCLDNVLLATGDRASTGITAALLGRRRMLAHERQRWAAAGSCLDRFGLGDLKMVAAERLTYGQRRWLELARVAMAKPRYLMADEPSAGLNDLETTRLAVHLRSFADEGVGVMLVDHKVAFLSEVADRAIVLALGRLVGEATIDAVWELPAVKDAYLGTRRVRR